MLKIQFKDKRQDPIWIVERRYTIGRADDNHLSVDDASLDPLHARLLTKNKNLYLKDNNSHNGSYVNNQRITEKQLQPGDTIRLGQVEIDVLDPHDTVGDGGVEVNVPHWSLVANSGGLSGQEFLITANPSVLGRGSQCDICIPGSHLSRQHIELTIQGNELHIRDLESANGTYLNDQRITEGVAKPGDQLRLDVYNFHIVGPGQHGDIKRPARRHAISTPVERKTVSSEPKQWKTKPTSPGNRIEPIPEATNSLSPWLLRLSLLLCGVSALTLIYLLFMDS